MAEPAWMAHAWAEIGQREGGGAVDNPRIAAFYRDVGHGEITHDEVAWCAAFVGAVFERSGIASTRSLLARSYLRWGEGIADGRLGAVAVFTRGADPASGHVAFYLDADDTHLFVLGGNQGDAVSVRAIPRSRLLGLRWPHGTGAVPEQGGENPSAKADFDMALAHVLEMEGGWTEDPHDPGGPTNFGVTLAVLAAYRGIAVDATSFPLLRQALRDIGRDEVRAIYLRRYWQPCRAEAMPPAFALMHFDASVNHGLGASSRLLQQAVGVDIDGEIGPATLAACAAQPVSRLLQRYADLRRARYRSLPHFWRFGRGWLARVDATLATALKLATRNPGGDTPMTEGRETPRLPMPASEGEAPSKWWGQSLTVWGALITAASTVVPAVGPLIGIEITGEAVKQLGGQAVQVAQALGGLAGTFLTIYGRIRATTRLERRSMTVHL